MPIKCDNCGAKVATVHLTEIKNGKKFEKHLCEQCAAQDGGFPTKGHTPINELLTNFVMQHSGLQPREYTAACEECGTTWAEFRQTGLFGCEHDYDRFERDLGPLLQRAHEGFTHHVGKVPTRRGSSAVAMRRALDLSRLRRDLARAVEAEDYERAAKLRDQIKQAEAEAGA